MPAKSDTQRQLEAVTAAIRADRLSEAERLLEPLRDSAPDDPDVWQLSGAVWLRRQRPADAARAYLRVTELAPGFSAGWVNLFRAREALGDVDGARAALDQAGELAPSNLNLLAVRADFLYRHGQLDEALAVVAQMQRLGAADAGLLSLKAAILQDSGRLEDAETVTRAALARDPGAAPLHLQLARNLEAQRMLVEAVQHYDQALAIDAEQVGAHFGRATALAALGRYDGAIDSLRRVLELEPDHPRAHYLLAAYLESNHRLNEAEEALARGLDRAPDSAHLRFARARLTGRRGDPAAALKQLDAIPESSVPAELEISLAAERGRLNDRLGRFEPAMAAFERGNRAAAALWRAAHPGPNPVRARLERLVAWLSDRAEAPWPAATPRRPATIAFLLGFPRTGTTLLGRLLDAHPACDVLDEFPTVGHLARIVDANLGGYPDALSRLGPARIARLAATYRRHVTRLGGGDSPLLIDKLPMNTQYLPLIRRVFPDAPIIYANRHPLAACLSCYMQPFELNPAMANFFTLSGAAAIYRLSAEVRRQDRRLWADSGLIEVRYEQVVNGLEASARGLLDFLGLPWSDRVLEFAAHARERGNVRTPSYAQVSESIYGDAIDRWQNYREYLEEIAVELADEIETYRATS